jgi:hypothetical protein
MMRTPCCELRQTLREDLLLWREVMLSWRAARDDMPVKLALDELSLYQQRVPGVEYLGQPTIALADIRNMLWDVDLRLPDDGGGSSSDDLEHLPRVITMGQAITLGIVDLPWVRGYAWEDREAPPPDDVPLGAEGGEDEGASMSGACCPPSSSHTLATDLGRLNSTIGGSRSRCSTSRQERLQQLMGLTDQSNRRQIDELELERARLEVQAAELHSRAHQVAADGMTQRLWVSTETFRPRWKHRFCGCEMCTKLPVHHVGLRRENFGVAVDIVLCATCYHAHYADEDSVAYRMYTWFLVRDLVAPS